jgi:predicted metal-dependent phosphoesterase TrpH
LKWDTHCHTIYSNRWKRRFDALNTPREMIEAAWKKGLRGIIITDHDNVKGGLVGKEIATKYKDFKVIPGAEITSSTGHILAVGIDSNIPKGLGVEETIERIHKLGGIAIASHPFSVQVRPSLAELCVKTDAVEAFNANNRGLSNLKAISFANQNHRPMTAGSDAHWARNLGDAGIICENPIEDIRTGNIRIFGKYTRMWDVRIFNFRQFTSALVNRPLWR